MINKEETGKIDNKAINIFIRTVRNVNPEPLSLVMSHFICSHIVKM